MKDLKTAAADLMCEINAPGECAIGGDWACTSCRVRQLAAELEPRVCRGCDHFNGDGCSKLYAKVDDDGDAELCVDDHPDGSDPLQIEDPDDFGCNKWEAQS